MPSSAPGGNFGLAEGFALVKRENFLLKALNAEEISLIAVSIA